MRRIASAEATEKELKGVKLVGAPRKKRRPSASIRGIRVVLGRAGHFDEIIELYRILKKSDKDEKEPPELAGLDGGGRAIIVVIADDDPDFVITTFPDD